MAKVEIIFKSGASTTIALKELTYKRDTLGASLSWESFANGDNLIKIDLDEVAAIIERK